MANEYIKKIKQLHTKGPLILGGWSFGGTIALEVAKKLNCQGIEVDQVILFDTMNHNLFIEEQIKLSDIVCPEEVNKLLLSSGIDCNSEEAVLIRNEWLIVHQLLLKYKHTYYNGKVVLVKAMIAESSYHDMSSARKMILNKLQDDLQNGFGDLLQNLNVIPIQANHFGLFDENFLHKIADIIQKLNNTVTI